MVLPAPLQTSSYRVFLSSGDDVVPLRDRTERLCEIASEVLSRNDRSSRLEVDRWEDAAPHVVDTDKVNDEFVDRALASHLVVALLLHEIRPGTFEELEAVLAHGGIDVAVFRFDTGSPPSPELAAFLEKWKNRLIYRTTGGPESDDAWYELTRSIMDLMIRVLVVESGSEGYVDDYRV